MIYKGENKMQFTINIDEKMFNESNIGETIKKSFESMSQEV